MVVYYQVNINGCVLPGKYKLVVYYQVNINGCVLPGKYKWLCITR